MAEALMSMGTRWRAAGTFLIALVALLAGAFALNRIDTDSYSEKQAYYDARHILAGEHRWGIVSYAHYPNGPSYILLPFMRMGVLHPTHLRWIPLTLSVLAVGALSWMSLGLCTTPLAAGGTLLFWLILLSQPGFFAWQGALHEHSYALSLLMALIAGGLATRRPYRWVYGIAGFVGGWIGYDPFFIWAMSLATARWAAYNMQKEGTLKDRFRWTALDTGAFVTGVVGAVGLHLLQNALFFGGIRPAFQDLAGAAALRLGVSSGAYQEVAMHPQQWTFMRMPVTMTLQFLYSFSRGGTLRHSAGLNAFSTVLLLPALLGAMVAILRAYRGRLETLSDAPEASRGLRWSLGVALAGVMLANYAWLVVMPEHSLFHQIFLPRHFFCGVLWMGLLPVWVGHVQVPASPKTSTRP